MKRNFFILAVVACVVFASCTNNDFVGSAPDTSSQGVENAITFGSGLKAVTRADGVDAANLLGEAFKVYGVKSNKDDATKYDDVFVNYSVKYNTGQIGKSDYNNGWYYVGAEPNQYIKYWDYKSTDYHFVAGSPVANFTYTTNAKGNIGTATVSQLGGRLNEVTTVASTQAPAYVADPKVVVKANYNSEVEFTFKALQSKVRVGIYETISGYKISSITFYNNAASPTTSDYITLNGTDSYFQGGPVDATDTDKDEVSGTITYDWTTTPASYTFFYSGDGLTKDKCWKGGQFASGVPAVSSAGTVADLYGTETNYDANGYFVVLPTPSATPATDLSIRCDYVLESLDGSGEKIEVDNATATIPAAYTKWAPNTAYTYLFKITDNNLYPITFDAVVIDEIQVGTVTTVSAPSITCYQDGNVDGTGIKFVAGKDVTVSVSEASNISIKKLSGAFDYAKSYDKQNYDTSFTEVTSSTLTAPVAGTYIIKATTTATPTKVAYFVLVVGAAEVGPTN